MKTFLILIALFVIISESAFSQPVAFVVPEPSRLTCPANPVQLAYNIAKQERQNAVADSMGWTVIRGRADLDLRVRRGEVVPVPASGRGYYLKTWKRYQWSLPFLVRPTFDQMVTLSHEFADEFVGSALRLTTLYRTEEMQRQLRKVNKSGASCDRPSRCSLHLPAASFDISYGYLNQGEYDWVLRRLETLEEQGKIIFVHEVCPLSRTFHVFALPTPAKEDDMLATRLAEEAVRR